ncbi:MAG: phosphatase PAP2 family protein [Dermatophilaceae bacterium]
MISLQKLDDQLFLAINSFARHTTWLHAPFLAYAKYGLALFALLLLAGVLISRHSQTETLAAAGWACIATLVALGLNQPVGHLFAEPRPYVTHPYILRLADVTTDFSFPSDHAVMGGAVAAGLLLFNRRLGLLATFTAALMAFARVYIGAHYPWDVLGGLALGAAVVWFGWWPVRRPLIALTDWLRRQPGPRAVFAEREHSGPGPATTRDLASRP